MLKKRLDRIAAACAVIALGVSSARAEFITVEVHNDTASTMYSLYAWPSDLVPRTYSVLGGKLPPGGTQTLKVEDVFSSCTFSFLARFNDRQKKRPTLRAKPVFVPDVLKERINLCTYYNKNTQRQINEAPIISFDKDDNIVTPGILGDSLFKR